jgi:putative NADH-flavin reductase
MKKLIVFGASGRTGMQVVKQALEAGFTVTAVVRTPDIFPLKHERLLLVKGEVLKLSTFESSMAGQDAVISCLGARNLKPTTLYSEGVANIAKAMQIAGVSRIICLSASGIEIEPELPLPMRLFIKHILQPILKNSYSDLKKMEDYLRQSNLNWTIVRPPRLNNKTVTAKYRIVVNVYMPRQIKISRADVAHYMVNHIDDTTAFRAVAKIAD